LSILFLVSIFSVSLQAHTATYQAGDTLFTRSSDTTFVNRVDTTKEQITHIVKKGDCLYALSGKYLKDANRWREILRQLPFLNQPGRVFTNKAGQVIVLIYPNEELRFVAVMGVTATKMMVINNTIKGVVRVAPSWMWPLLILLLAALAGLIAYVLYRRNQEAQVRTYIPQGPATHHPAPQAAQPRREAVPPVVPAPAPRIEPELVEAEAGGNGRRNGNGTQPAIQPTAAAEAHAPETAAIPQAEAAPALRPEAAPSAEPAAEPQAAPAPMPKTFLVNGEAYVVPQGGKITIRTIVLE
jgi:hypothetical protein